MPVCKCGRTYRERCGDMDFKDTWSVHEQGAPRRPKHWSKKRDQGTLI